MLRMFQTIRSYSSTRLFSLIIAVAFTAAVGIAARSALRNRLPVSEAVQTAETAVSALPNDQDRRLISHLLTLQPTGFEPAEVSWEKGRFFLVIDNRTAIGELTFQVNRVQGGRVKEVKLKMHKQRSAGVFDLTPGRYLLTEVNHPQWVCRINID